SALYVAVACAHQGPAVDRLVQPGADTWGHAGGCRVRRLCRQYDPADLSAVHARTGDFAAAAAPDRADDRRSSERGRGRLGVVLRWMVEREWRCRCARLDQRRRT